ncbi:HAD family hydrolase [Tessaracoccus caeni]|uniref:HAD family hydrolase n=1 Tax=Tessaracoccus caeni TaxID=3031239 RepID=UPI0023DC363C|nr:HAD family phosphatase [Tessaracoccus caeni]MDF1487588.1 HAD family phosphatase [Tessaracoccus caeni]
MTACRFAAVLFDCDGVLVDSEAITLSVLREMLHEMGWPISVEECHRRFVGTAFKDEWKVIYDHTGVAIDDEWIVGFRARRDVALRARLTPVPGAGDAVRAVVEAGIPVACVSGADRHKVEMQLGIVGIRELFGDRIFSGVEVPRSKPAPDVYLAATTALGVDPAACAVVEDSPPGVRAGVAAGATVFGFAGDGPTYQSPEKLLELGAARTFTSMSELPGLLLEQD